MIINMIMSAKYSYMSGDTLFEHFAWISYSVSTYFSPHRVSRNEWTVWDGILHAGVTPTSYIADLRALQYAPGSNIKACTIASYCLFHMQQYLTDSTIWTRVENRLTLVTGAIFCNTSSEGEGIVATPLWIFYNERPISLCLLPLYSQESPLSIDTKINTIHLRM